MRINSYTSAQFLSPFYFCYRNFHLSHRFTILSMPISSVCERLIGFMFCDLFFLIKSDFGILIYMLYSYTRTDCPSAFHLKCWTQHFIQLHHGYECPDGLSYPILNQRLSPFLLLRISLPFILTELPTQSPLYVSLSYLCRDYVPFKTVRLCESLIVSPSALTDAPDGIKCQSGCGKSINSYA